jgi:Glu-tRNA(Gln) amidotransferase subunit E-like FAD-binding protein
MEKRPFNEKTMREFKSIQEALKVYGEEQIPKKRIVWLFQEANEIRFINTSVNANYLQSLNKTDAQKFIDKLCGKNKSKIKAFEKALAIWKSKFSETRVPVDNVVKEPLAEAKTSETSPEAPSDSN